MLVLWIYPPPPCDRRLPGRLPDYPSPKLQADPAADMLAFSDGRTGQAQQRRVGGPGKGIGHIPIDEAMRRIAASGIPDWPK